MSDMPEGKKKVDEDWKRRAQLERDADAAKAGGEKKPAPAPAASSAEAQGPAPEAPPDNGNKINPLFPGLVESLASQALMFMGGMRDPMTGQVMQDLNQAQTMIDMLSMIEEKTKGNLAVQEAELLKQILDEVRTQFVRVANPVPRVPKGGPPMMGNRPPGR